jgi:ribosomal protein S18 acetylase RimI-like enzyme
MPDAVSGKAAKAATYRAVAHIHATCINQGFLPTLGERFLSLLYEAIDADPSSALFVEEAEGAVVGFVAGGRGMGPIYRQMIKRWPQLLLALLPALLNPSKLKRIFEIVLFTRKQKPVSGCPKAELFSIAILDDARGRGVAERLYEALMQRFAEEGESAFCIVVGEGLAPAHRFYRRMGAVPMAEISVHQGQASTLYRHDLLVRN